MEARLGDKSCVILFVSMVVLCLAAGAANSGTIHLTYKVLAGADDGYAWSATGQDIGYNYLLIGDDRTYTAPYYMSAMRFTNINASRNAKIVDAHLKISSISEGFRGQIYGIIQAEAADDATDFSSRYIGAISKTTAATNWDHKDNWAANTYYTSPDISGAIQEVVSRNGWNSGNAMTICYSTRTDAGKSRMFGSFEAGAGFAAVLEIIYETYSISGYIKTADNTPIEAVAVSAGADIESTTTDAGGYYELKIPPGWSGTVNVSKESWGFTPGSYSYSNVTTDQTEQGFIAEYIGIQVKIDGSGDFTSIQDAIDYVSEGDMVRVHPGRYYENIYFKGKNIILTSLDPNNPNIVNTTIIDAAGEGSVVTFAGTETSECHLAGITITGGGGISGGGGINGANTKAIITNCTISNNSTYLIGAGLYGCDGQITDCIIKNNSAFSFVYSTLGGGLYDCNATISGCTITDNSASSDYSSAYGGGLSDCTGTVSNCTIQNNRAFSDYKAYGGGLYRCSNTISNCTIQNNVAVSIHSASYGGGLSNCDGTIINCDIKNNGITSPQNIVAWGGGLSKCNGQIKSCTIMGNTSSSCGGGLYDCRGQIVDCQITNNSTVNAGGGLYLCRGEITNCIINGNNAQFGGGFYEFTGDITNCTIEDNSATDSGGGVLYFDGQMIGCIISNNSALSLSGGGLYSCDAVIKNCLIKDNSAARSGGGLQSCEGTIINCAIVGNTAGISGGGLGYFVGTFLNNIIWNNLPNQMTSNFASISYCSIQDWTGGGIGNISDDPLFTDAANGDYHLSGLSPCVDSGDPNYVTGPNDTDIDGDPRVIVRIDMGVDEFFDTEYALFHLSEKQFNFTALEDRSNPEPNSFIIRNYGLPDLDWSISEDCSWLQVNPSSGTIVFEGQAVVDVNVDITGMGAGDYNCVLIVADPEAENSPMSIEVHLEITGPELSIDINEFNFQASKETLIPPEQFLTVTNATTGGTLNWNITIPNDCNWLSVSPNSGSCTTEPNIVSLMIDVNEVDYGSYSCQFTVSDPNATNSPQVLTVNLEVLPPELSISDSTFNFIAAGIDSDTATQILTIQNTGFDSLNWHIAMPNDCNWLKASPLAGQAGHMETDEVILSIDHNNVEYGTYSCQFQIVDPNAANSPHVVTVNLEVLGPELTVSPARFSFETALEEPNTAGQILSIQNTGYDTLYWDVNIPIGCGWLSASETSGQATSEVDEVILSIDHNNIERGFYQCEILISAPDVENSPQVIPVDLRVLGIKGQLYVPTDYPTIQAAVDAAVDGDEVIIEPGTYSGTENYNIFLMGKAITVRSVDPNNPAIVAATIIEPNTIASVFVYHYYSGNQAGPVIDGLTIKRCIGRAAIYCSGGNPTIRNCIIEDNYNYDSSYYGGTGIECYGGSAVISNCVFRNNQGSGLRCSGSDPIVRNCTFAGNRCSYNHYYGETSFGGGILLEGGDISVINCTFSGNLADVGGGICSFGNYAYINNVTISNCIFWDNDANDGPQIALKLGYKDNPPTVSVSYSDVQGGEAAVYVDPCCTLEWGEGNLDIDPCFAEPGYWILAPSPPIPPPPPPPPPYPPPVPSDDIWVDGDYHLKSQKGRWKLSIYIGLDPTRDNFINLLDFAALANSWQKQGGSIPADFDRSGTVELSDLSFLLDNYLTSYTTGQWVLDNVTSPCIDAGDPSSNWTPELWPHGKRINMGAYGGTPEAGMSLSNAGNIVDLNGDGCVDYTDMMLLTDKWLYEAILLAEDLDRNGFVNFTDVAIFANNWQGIPDQASCPNPADGAIGIDPNTDLSWTADHSATSHDVYFGTRNPPPFVCNQTSTTFEAGKMAYSTKYYWRIDEVNSGGVTTGTVWSFRTYGPPPP